MSWATVRYMGSLVSIPVLFAATERVWAPMCTPTPHRYYWFQCSCCHNQFPKAQGMFGTCGRCYEGDCACSAWLV